MNRSWWAKLSAAALVAALLAPSLALAQQVQPPAGQQMRFAEQIAAFQAADQANPPKQGQILLIGSSLFRLWDQVEEQMAPLPVLNRGFGGSRTWEALAYMDQIVFPYNPRIILYYEGSNDVNAGQPANEIVDRFKQFAARVAERLPRTKIFYVSPLRSPDKQERWEVVDQINSQMQAFAATSYQVDFIDVNPPLHNPDGTPKNEWYTDGQHITPEAYVEWGKIVKPIVAAQWGRAPEYYGRTPGQRPSTNQ
jgi:lysophospholipase L1-like esterase